MRFVVDMGISVATVDRLRALGHDAVHLRERGLQQLPDEEILKLAHREQRILLTHDLDFSDLVAAAPSDLPAVILFRLRSMRPENVNRHLEAVLSEHEQTFLRPVVASVSEGRIRIRTLPV